MNMTVELLFCGRFIYTYEIIEEYNNLSELEKTYFYYEKFAHDLFMTDYRFEDGYIFRHS